MHAALLSGLLGLTLAQPAAAPAALAQPTPSADEESAVDFAAEETESDRQSQRIIAAAGGQPAEAGGGTGFKLFVDLLAEYPVGQRRFEFRPNHFYVLLQARVKDDLALTLHISEAPVFYELTWNLTARLALKAGKLLVPFGTNEFHHLIGGRVDELSSFLPETWGDFGLGLTHVAYDGDNVAVEYAFYLVNGFEGQDEPVISTGDPADNNLAKGIGTRVKVELLGHVVVTGSAYVDWWDVDNAQMILFYAAGLELRPGLIPVPGLRRLRLRGEWARGELQIEGENWQRGLTRFATLRGGYYGELTYPLTHAVAARARVGRVNPDNRVGDAGDVDVWEPALLINAGKLTFTVAYQLVARVGRPYRPKSPPDVAYAKLFLQF